ncbi:MAG: 3-phosphoshikimate 1-carboxyvinyltransferase [Acidobacteria bacterium]|nr:MAG: 3-phosphoshikimate 1-carboxyvinyltransferase [Acidobacteriota bacterium]
MMASSGRPRFEGLDLSRLPDPLRVPGDRFRGGRIAPPPSKSYSHRALNLAWLGGAPLRVLNLLDAEDTSLFRSALVAAGWSVEVLDRRIGAIDLDLRPPEPDARPPRVRIDCGNAGTMFRFLAATLTVVAGRFELDGTPRLRERPIGPLIDALRQLGARIEYLGEAGFAPLAIEGSSLVGGRCSLDAGSSSQFLSALLMAGAFSPRPIEVELRALTSRPYVEVTCDAMARQGASTPVATADGWRTPGAQAPRVPAGVVQVEADDSAVPYPAAAAMISGCPVELAGLRRDSIQGDRGFLDLLSRMGGELEWLAADDGSGEVLRVGGRVRSAISVDMSSMPDQVPTLAALAAFAPGRTEIRGAAHLRIKESDRLEAMATELCKVGVVVEERADGLVIEGDPARSRRWPAAEAVHIDPRSDHRIAMSLALVGLRREELWIEDPATVAKSYPAFWQQLFGLG